MIANVTIKCRWDPASVSWYTVSWYMRSCSRWAANVNEGWQDFAQPLPWRASALELVKRHRTNIYRRLRYWSRWWRGDQADWTAEWSGSNDQLTFSIFSLQYGYCLKFGDCSWRHKVNGPPFTVVVGVTMSSLFLVGSNCASGGATGGSHYVACTKSLPVPLWCIRRWHVRRPASGESFDSRRQWVSTELPAWAPSWSVAGADSQRPIILRHAGNEERLSTSSHVSTTWARHLNDRVELRVSRGASVMAVDSSDDGTAAGGDDKKSREWVASCEHCFPWRSLRYCLHRSVWCPRRSWGAARNREVETACTTTGSCDGNINRTVRTAQSCYSRYSMWNETWNISWKLKKTFMKLEIKNLSETRN
jgi:hypothetical protein